MIFFRMFKHLLPRARAWQLTIESQLRQFFEGLSGFGGDVKTYYDQIWLDIFPESTRELAAWEDQFALTPGSLSESERRERLAGAWQALGGQSPRYIQDTLRNAGFDVYIHEWWTPNTFPLAAFYCGDPGAECGELGVECVGVFATARNPFDVLAPDNQTPVPGKGYPLVNKITEIEPNLIILSGEAIAACGEPAALCYNYTDFIVGIKRYDVPTDPARWPYILYIGGETFGDLAQIPASRRDEFENLCLKICPAQQWLGILVEYV